MKRLLTLTLALVLCLSLAACGGGKTSGGAASSGGASSDGGFSTDLAQFYTDNTAKAIEAGEFPMMMELDDDMLESIYPGLTDVERKQTASYIAAISAVTCEVTMVELADGKDMETVLNIFETRIDNQVADGNQYPETIENWKNHSVISTRGNYVCLFVMPPEFGDLAGAFNALERTDPPQKAA